MEPLDAGGVFAVGQGFFPGGFGHLRVGFGQLRVGFGRFVFRRAVVQENGVRVQIQLFA